MTEVFVGPMEALDPGHVRQKEAVKRIVRLYQKPEVAKNPAVRAFNDLLAGVQTPLGRKKAELAFALIRLVGGVDMNHLMHYALEEIQSPGGGKEGRGGRPMSAVEMAGEIFEA